VRHVGDAVAVASARRSQRRRMRPEDVVDDIEAAAGGQPADTRRCTGAPQIYDEVPGNVGLDYPLCDREAVKGL